MGTEDEDKTPVIPPPRPPLEHVIDDQGSCWCIPTVGAVDPETGEPIHWVHNLPN